jgi:hypothetical protein
VPPELHRKRLGRAGPPTRPVRPSRTEGRTLLRARIRPLAGRARRPEGGPPVCRLTEVHAPLTPAVPMAVPQPPLVCGGGARRRPTQGRAACPCPGETCRTGDVRPEQRGQAAPVLVGSGRVVDLDPVVVVRHVADPDLDAGLAGHPRAHVVALPEADPAGGQRAGAGVFQGERPQICGRHVPQRGGIVLPRLKRGLPSQRSRPMPGVPPERPGQQPGGEVLEAEQHLVLRAGGPFAGARLTRIAGQPGQEHALHRPVQALHRALEVRGVGRQVLHRHVQDVERGGHRPGQEVLAPVHPHLLRQTAERAVGVLAQDRRAQRGQHRLPRRMPRRDRDTGDRVRRAVGEPRDPRPAWGSLDIDQHRGLDMIGLPHLVTPPRPGQKHIVLARCPLPSRKPGPLPRRQITLDRPVQRRNRRRRLPLTPGRPSGQLTMDRGHIPLPQRQQCPDLRGDREPPVVRGPLPRRPRDRLVLFGSGKPPPHRPLPHPQSLRRRPHLPGSELPLPAQDQQPAHRRPPQRPNRHSRQTRRPVTRPHQNPALLILCHPPITATTPGPADKNSRI